MLDSSFEDMMVGFNFLAADNDARKSIMSPQVKMMEKRELKTDIKGLFLCHVTKYFPEGGVIYPRRTIEINGRSPLFLGVLNQSLTLGRSTMHFAVNHLVGSHIGFDTNDLDIIVMIPLELMKKRVAGGYIEDVIVFGRLEIPVGSTIMIPSSSIKALNSKIAMLPSGVNVEFYDPKISLRKNIENFFVSQGTHYLDLKGVVDNENAPIYVGKFGSEQYVSSLELMKILNRTVCVHSLSPFSIIENLFINSQSGMVRVAEVRKAPFIDKLCIDGSFNSTMGRLDKYFTALRNNFNSEALDSNELNRFRDMMALVVVNFYQSQYGSAGAEYNDLYNNWSRLYKFLNKYDALNIANPSIVLLVEVTGLDFKERTSASGTREGFLATSQLHTDTNDEVLYQGFGLPLVISGSEMVLKLSDKVLQQLHSMFVSRSKKLIADGKEMELGLL